MIALARPTGREPRWSGARLWVYTVPMGTAPCSLIVRREVGRQTADKLWHRSQIPFEPGSVQSRNPEYAIALALAACIPLATLQEALKGYFTA